MYYPYPAYGTYDENSLPGSTASLYNMDASDGGSMNQAIPGTAPVPLPEGERSRSNSANTPYLSSSCPVVTSKLKGVRDALHEEGRAQQDNGYGPEHSSLGKINEANRLSQQSLNFPNDVRKSSFSTPGNGTTTSSESSSDSETDSKINNFAAERSAARTKSGSKPKEILLDSSIPPHVNKNQILSATPPSNMVTRQVYNPDFQKKYI